MPQEWHPTIDDVRGQCLIGTSPILLCLINPQVGAHLLQRLAALQKRHSIIGDVRGRGLMLGVELVRDRATKVGTVAECPKGH